MNRNRHPGSGLEWVPIVSMAFGALCLIVVVLILVFSGHPLGKMLLWGSLGLAAGAALDFLIRLLVRSRRSYWMLAAPIFVVILVGVPVLGFTILSDWFVAVGNSAPGSFTVQPAAFDVYLGFIVTFPGLAWSRDRARARGQREQV